MAGRDTLACVVAAAAALVAPRAGAAASGGETRTQPPARVVHIRLDADLDHRPIARRLVEELHRADAAGAPVVLEIRSNRWRTDLVGEIAQALQGAEHGATVVLADPSDGRVGAGLAALALTARGAVIDRKTMIVGAGGDDRRELAAEGTDIAAAVGLVTMVVRDVRSASVDVRLVEQLLHPSTEMWALDAGSGQPWRLSPSRPVEGRAEPLVGREVGGCTLRCSSGLAVDLGIATAAAPDARRAVALAIDGRPTSPTIRITGTLSAHERDVRARVAELDADLDGIDQRVDRVEKDRTASASARGRKASGLLGQCEAARGLVADVGRRMEECPEVLRCVPPNDSGIALEADDRPAAWRRAIQKRLERIAKLESRLRMAAE